MQKQLLLAEFSRAPWALHPDYLTTYSSVLHRWASGVQATDETMAGIQADQATRAGRKQAAASIGNGIAVLPLYGVLTQRASMVEAISGAGGTSTERFSQAFRAAMNDDSVAGIILELDSPGGSVFGTGELATEIMNARGRKPVFGFINSLCASAAYWIGSACSELHMTPGGQVGSIGVLVAHSDESQALATKGVKTTFVSAGKYKTEGNSTAPLTDEARAHMQSLVNGYYQTFTSAVAKGRGVPVASVRDGMGQGRCVQGADALAQKMVDSICTLDQVVARMRARIKTGGSPTASPLQRSSASAQIAANARNRELAIANIGNTAKHSNAAVAAARRRREIELAMIGA